MQERKWTDAESRKRFYCARQFNWRNNRGGAEALEDTGARSWCRAWRKPIYKVLSVEGGILPWHLCQVAGLQLHVPHRGQSWTNCSEPVSHYCHFGTNGKGFQPLPADFIVHRAGHYTSFWDLRKWGLYECGWSRSGKDSEKEAFPVQENAMRVEGKLSCNAILTAKMKQTGLILAALGSTERKTKYSTHWHCTVCCQNTRHTARERWRNDGKI